jgi:hypothetical protein
MPEPLRHETGSVLMAGQRRGDPGPFERIDKRQDLATGNTKRALGACKRKPSRNEVGSSHFGQIYASAAMIAPCVFAAIAR